MTITPLPLITALARSGALDRAWALFEDGGYMAAADDAAALAVKGRLLKDRGLKAVGAARRELFAQSAAAYAAADALSPAPYLLINVATLAFLSGDHARGAEMARAVLSRLDDGGDIAETPYWLGATRAEAHLLLGQTARADASLASAIAHAPDSWADHASTLKQFGLILAESGASADWLTAHRPPLSAHFAGHLGVSGPGAVRLATEVGGLFRDHRIGFAFGALAAGADIIIAEAALLAGAELHVILPVRRALYLTQSVLPYAQDWLPRFEHCINAATSVSEISPIDGAFEPLTIALAGDVAMGSTVLHARMLETSACQIIVADDGDGPYGNGLHTARDAARWAARGHPQFVLKYPRTAEIAASGNAPAERPAPTRRIAAMLHTLISGTQSLKDEQWALLEEHVTAPLRAVAEGLEGAAFFQQGFNAGQSLAFDLVESALSAGLALMDYFAAIDLPSLGLPKTLSLTIGGHYDIIHSTKGSDGRADAVFGGSVSVAPEIAQRAHPGSICVTENFATALAFLTERDIRTELIGDHLCQDQKTSLRLFAVMKG
jgi:hypothetical protein